MFFSCYSDAEATEDAGSAGMLRFGTEEGTEAVKEEEQPDSTTETTTDADNTAAM